MVMVTKYKTEHHFKDFNLFAHHQQNNNKCRKLTKFGVVTIVTDKKTTDLIKYESNNR